MQMKKESHIKFYTKEKWQEIGSLAGLKLKNDFTTTIRFLRQKSTVLEFDNIIKHHSDNIIKGYDV